MSANPTISLVTQLNALAGGLFLLSAFGMVATRQVLACLKLFVVQALLLACSACFLGYLYDSYHLFVVAAIALVSKVFLIPWLLRGTLGDDMYARREVSQVLNVPTALLIALALAMFAYFFTHPLLGAGDIPPWVNVPIGMAGLLIGALVVAVRREAIPQVIGILAMENGAFLAGVSIAPTLTLIAELAAAMDVVVVALVFGFLTKRIHEHVGTTAVGQMTALREE